MKPFLSWISSNLPVFTVAVFLVAIAAVCSGCYLLTEGITMIGYLDDAVPLDDLANDDEASEEDREFVQRVKDIRSFAMDELGLKESKNYTRYVELDRNYLAAVVSASPNDSFGRHEWWYPIVGKLPYKGFFNIEDARKERTKLEKKDMDVWIRTVNAFSTLGWFKDPLYSYMKNYSDRTLADMIIHELVHATVFIKGQAQFNEQLAEFVGTEGGRIYAEKLRGKAAPGTDTGDAGEAGDAEADRAAYLAFIQGLIAELDAVYKNDVLLREEKLSRKEEIIEAAKARFAEQYDRLFKTENYKSFSQLPINNAYLELYRLYYEEDNYFKDLYESSGSDLRLFIAAAKTLANEKKAQVNPREEFEKALKRL
ncbi:MAG: aminopeptidase [Treponema sp.]|jgi:predicted aminopeptidase|nr:aminopeptidase [Treponema sp.]